MTSKALMSAFFRKGKQVLQGVLKSQTQKVGVKVSGIPKPAENVQHVVTYNSQLTKNKLFNVWQKILPRVYFHSLASELGRKAASRCGRMPLFAFVGIVMAQHADKEEDEIADRIQDFLKNVEVTRSPLLQKIQELSLDQFEFGQLIGQGCNAAVYEACLKNESLGVELSEAVDNVAEEENAPQVIMVSEEKETMIEEDTEAEDDGISDTDSDITILSLSDDDMEESEKAPLEFQIDTEDDFIDFPDSDSDISVLDDLDSEEEGEGSSTLVEQSPTHELSLSMSCTKILEAVRGSVEDTEVVELPDDFPGGSLEYDSLDSSFSTEASGRFNLAVKMMFNYGVESNADTIMKEMARETVPARLAQTHAQMETWQNGHKVRKKSLPPHPNIVEMWGVFVDPVPHFPDCLLNYPAALPARINPQGIGRNMTMFLVMKKYNCL